MDKNGGRVRWTRNKQRQKTTPCWMPIPTLTLLPAISQRGIKSESIIHGSSILESHREC